jgi:hypothetical protein
MIWSALLAASRHAEVVVNWFTTDVGAVAGLAARVAGVFAGSPSARVEPRANRTASPTTRVSAGARSSHARFAGGTLDRVGLLVLAGSCLGAFHGGADHEQGRGGDQQCRCHDRQPVSIPLHANRSPHVIQDKTDVDPHDLVRPGQRHA